MYKKMMEIWKLLNRNIYTGKREKDNLHALTIVSALMVILGLVMVLRKITTGDMALLISAIMTILCGIACAYFACIQKNREMAALILTLFCVLTFTMYTMRGMGAGTGILWSLMVPIGLCYLASVRNGILVSIYYTVLFFVLFYTPVGWNLHVYYTEPFMMMFPVLYASISVFTAISMIHYHRGVLLENEYTEKLNKEVALQTEEAESRARKIEQISLQTIQTLTSAIDAKDPYTRGHSFRVSQYSVLLAEALHWTPERIHDLRYAAMLHDVGKIGVPDSILNKPDRLTDMEYRIIQSHTTMGGDILKDRTMIQSAENVARCHHERYDGNGYPLGLKGEEISEEARIVAIADSFDAMSSNRVYLKAYDFDHIRREILMGRGKQYDPHFTDVFIDLWDRGMLDEILQSLEEKDDEDIEVSSEQLKSIMAAFLHRSRAEETDTVTGLMNRHDGEVAIARRMREQGGAVVLFELQNLAVIDDGNGHESVNRGQNMMGDILRGKCADDLCCQVDWNQFLLFLPEATDETAENRILEIISAFESSRNGIKEMDAITLSAGAVMCHSGEPLGQVFHEADKALYYVKQRRQNGYSFYVSDSGSGTSSQVDLDKLVNGIHNTTSYRGAMDVEYQQFARLYEYVTSLSRRFSHPIHLVMITLTANEGEQPLPNELERAMFFMEQSIRQNIRNVDVLTKYNQQNFLIILIGTHAEGVKIAVERIFRSYYKMIGSSTFSPSYSVANADEEP